MNKVPTGKAAVVKALLKNPAVRRVVVKNAKSAVTAATTAYATRSASRSAASGTPAKKVDSVAVTNFVSSVAKPVAEKMAGTQTGRSVLRSLNDISGEVLGTGSKPAENPLNAFITKLAGAAAGAAGARSTAGPPKPEAPSVKFTPLTPPKVSSAEPVKSVKWPPPKNQVSRSGTDTAPE